MTGQTSSPPGLAAYIVVLLLIISSVIVSFSPSFKNVSDARSADGCGVYCLMATEYGVYLSESKFDKYYFQKSLPAAIVHVLHISLGISMEAASINRSFGILRNVALAITLIFWAAICRTKSVGSAMFLIGAFALSINQMMLLDAPVTHEDPDPFSVLISMAFVYFCLQGRAVGMWVCMLLALFIQPQCALLMMPVFLLHPRETSVSDDGSRLSVLAHWLSRKFQDTRRYLEGFGVGEYLVWGGALSLWFIICLYIFPLVHQPYVFHGGAGSSDLLAPLGAAMAAGLMSVMMTRVGMLDALQKLVEGLASSTVCRRLIAVLALKLAAAFIVGYFGRGEVAAITSSTLGTVWLIYSWFFHGAQQPLQPWLAHLVYFGPVVLLAAVFWTRLTHFINILDFGPGMNISLGMIALLSINSESRHLVAFVPWLLVLVLCGMNASTDRSDLRARTMFRRPFVVAGFFLAALVTSRVYVSAGFADDRTSWLAKWGPWWTWADYYWAVFIGLVATCLGLAIWHWLRSTSSDAISS